MTDEPMTNDELGSEIVRGRSLRQAAILTAAVGIVFSVLFTVSLVLISAVPSATATDEEIRTYYNSEAASTAVTVGLYIMPFAGIAFIWFAVALRMWVELSGRRQGVLQSNLQFVSAVAFVLLTFTSAAAMAVVAVTLRVAEGIIDTSAARQFPVFGLSLMLFFAMRMAAMFVFTTSAIGRSSGILPRWFVYVGFLIGAFLLLSVTLSPLLVVLFPAWVLVLSLILLREARRIPADLSFPRRAVPPGPVPAVLHDPRPPDPTTHERADE
jgi:hypothetical protein